MSCMLKWTSWSNSSCLNFPKKDLWHESINKKVTTVSNRDSLFINFIYFSSFFDDVLDILLRIQSPYVPLFFYFVLQQKQSKQSNFYGFNYQTKPLINVTSNMCLKQMLTKFGSYQKPIRYKYTHHPHDSKICCASILPQYIDLYIFLTTKYHLLI